MNANAVEIAPEEQIYLLNKLKKLLEEQLQIIHKGSGSNERIDAFNKQAESVIGRIVETGILELEELNQQREQLKKLYNMLNLSIIAQKDETTKQLSHVRKGRNTIEVYLSNI